MIVMKKIINPKTLKTLSTLDRILLLREIPMFSGLSPEDLEKIAEVAAYVITKNHEATGTPAVGEPAAPADTTKVGSPS